MLHEFLTSFYEDQVLIIIVHIAGRCYFMDRNAMKHFLRKKESEIAREGGRRSGSTNSPSLGCALLSNNISSRPHPPHLTSVILHNPHTPLTSLLSSFTTLTHSPHFCHPSQPSHTSLLSSFTTLTPPHLTSVILHNPHPPHLTSVILHNPHTLTSRLSSFTTFML